jgi:alanyl aminopeptidase
MTITARPGDTVITNTPVSSESLTDGWKMLQFSVTKPLPTYLLAIAVGPMDSVEIPGLPVEGRIYTPRGMSALAEFAAGLTAPILEFQQAYFNMAYPYEKLDFIAVPEYWPGAMEHPGAITFAENILLMDANTVSAMQKGRLVWVIAHELAHQWFGNLVTLEWWDDLWLNEAFADWLGAKTIGGLYPDMHLDLVALRMINRGMNSDSTSAAEPIRRPVSGGADLLADAGMAYSKGKSVIGMFERWLGEDAFREGVNAYLLENAWGNATAQQFWQALSAAGGKEISTAMATFLDQPGVPLVETRHDGNRIHLSQRRFSHYGVDLPQMTWQFPVGLRIGADGKVLERTVFLESGETEVTIDGVSKIDWVMPNADGAGYYRWSVGNQAALDIAAGAEKALNSRERVEFLGNLGALLDGGMVSGDTYLQALGTFANDSEPLVVSAVIGELQGLQDTFIDAPLREEFAAYLRRSLSPALDRFGIEPRPGEDEPVGVLRPQLLYWLGRVGEDESVVAWALRTTEKYLREPSSVNPDQAGVALRIVAKSGHEGLWNRFRERFEAAQLPSERSNFLAALGAFEDPRIQNLSLGYALDGPMRPNELLDIPIEMFDAHEGGDRVFDWLLKNYDSVAARMPPLYLPMLAQLGGGCDSKRLEKAQAFFSQPGIAVEGTERQMQKTAAEVHDCVSLREREAASVRAYLQGH